jgi:alpha-beta hydrolase superfamily lysophospholipase
MQKFSRTNEVFVGANGRESLLDITIPENWNKKLIIFSHGYMGYKDWGAWNLMQDFFVERNFGFLKYNVSHNGGTVENGIDFPDLDAFSMNSYSKEMRDMETIIKYANENIEGIRYIHLIGHSRGGGMVLLQANHSKVSKIAALAPISDISNRFPPEAELKDWQTKGIRFTTNGRTKQQMPHHYTQFEDFIRNQSRLNIEKTVRDSKIPICVIHGEADPAVNISEGEAVAEWAGVNLIRIPNEQHTFGASQPWTEKKLPLGLEIVCEHLIAFFEN